MEATENTQPESPKKDLPDGFALFKPSWTAFKVNFEAFVWQLFLPLGLIFFVAVGVTVAIVGENPLVYVPALLIALALLLFCALVFASLIITELASAKGKELTFPQALRQTLPFIWRLAGLFILNVIIVGIGFVLLIVPGLFAIQRLLLSPYYLVDQNLGVFEAIRRSWRSGKNKTYSGSIWGVVGVLIAINLIGIVPYIGWVASFALSVAYLCAPAIRYFEITKQSGSVKS